MASPMDVYANDGENMEKTAMQIFEEELRVAKNDGEALDAIGRFMKKLAAPTSGSKR